MTTVPPLTSPRAYATHLLEAWRDQLAGSHHHRRYGSTLLATIKKELARRKAEALPTPQ